MLRVFITIDTEFSRNRCNGDAETNVDLDVFGKTDEGAFGIGYQAEVLNRYGLRGVFFVEALSACATGPGLLRRVADSVLASGHEVQLHLHTEWLRRLGEPLLGGRVGQHMRDFSPDDQAGLIARGLENLRACGAGRVNAFRAGNFGANCDTLRALARNGVPFDTSHNRCYLGGPCELAAGAPLVQPAWMEGVWEFPVSYFEDWPGHCRHAQICAASSQELEGALDAAAGAGWYSFVIVSHSFELLRRATRDGRPASPDRVLVRRFERLCQFLADNPGRFRTAGFSDLDPAEVPDCASARPIKSHVLRTAGRVAEQLLRRL